MPHFVEPQSGGVRGHEEDAMLPVAGGLEEADEFLLAVDLG
jgi:hypothetical protein